MKIIYILALIPLLTFLYLCLDGQIQGIYEGVFINNSFQRKLKLIANYTLRVTLFMSITILFIWGIFNLIN